MNSVMLQKWRDLLRAWNVTPVVAGQTFENVCEHYAEPGRFYHTLKHVQDVLETVEYLASSAQNLKMVKLAAWLHDVIYDSRNSDNEERSADYAEQLCQKLSIPDAGIVASLILKTKTHDTGDDPNAKVLIDADLAILGASESAYRTYAEGIRREYAWLPDPEYRRARQQILERFLASPKIYHFLIHLEEPARHNISAEVAELARR